MGVCRGVEGRDEGFMSFSFRPTVDMSIILDELCLYVDCI